MKSVLRSTIPSSLAASALPAPGKHVLYGVLLLCAFGFAYRSAVVAIVYNWISRHDYSHGFLIPPISLYLVWIKRRELLRLRIQPSLFWGLLIETLAGMMLLGGAVASVVILQELSFIVMIAGLILCTLGADYLRSLAFPIAYLLFMIPVMDFLTDPLQWSFQVLTARMAADFLQALGFVALVQSQYILLPEITLEVAQACSGVNFLVSIIAVGIPLAYLTQRSLTRGAILVGSAVIVGVVTNWLRVTLIGMWAYYGGAVLHGPFHVFQGLLVAVLGYLALFIGAWLLCRKPMLSNSSPVRGGRSEFAALNSRFSASKITHGLQASFVILVLFSCGVSFCDRGPVPLKRPLSEFPSSLGVWSEQLAGRAQTVPFTLSGADSQIVRAFTGPSRRTVQLYVAYFETQRHPKKIINHLSGRLHQGAREIELAAVDGRLIRVNQTNLLDQGTAHRASFFYVVAGRVFASQFQAKAAMALEALTHGRTNGAFVLVSTTSDVSEAQNEMTPDEQLFLRYVISALARFLV